MFGTEFSENLDILMRSFSEINEKYKKQAHTKHIDPDIITQLKKMYIKTFGIPEIGFQVRGMHFRHVVQSKLKRSKIHKILDAGSGIGAYSFWLTKNFPKSQITGGEIDVNKLESSQLMAKRLNVHNINFKIFDVTKTANRQLYDLILTIDVLEHVPHYQKALQNFYILLKPEGYLYIHVPQPNQQRIFSSFSKWDHADHVRDGLQKKKLESILKKIGFRIISSEESFGFLGKLAWEINHWSLTTNFSVAAIMYPFCYFLSIIDFWLPKNNGLGTAILVQKK